MIGSIFNINKSQVRYLRNKVGLSNKHKVKIKKHPEIVMYFSEVINKRPNNLSNYECEKIVNQIIQEQDRTKEKVLNTQNDIGNKITIENGGEELVYNVHFSSEKYMPNSKASGSCRKSNGSRRNYKKETETKITHGKIGEKIAIKAEQMRLIQIGLKDLVNEVKSVAQINEEITLDGLGYDLISFNEKRERICIEVKTSYGKQDKPFFISKKELEIMRGLKAEYDCKHCLIYYLSIDKSNVTIKTIEPYDLENLQLTPILYKVGKNTKEIF